MPNTALPQGSGLTALSAEQTRIWPVAKPRAGVFVLCVLQVHLYDGELEAARWCALEEASLDGSRLLAYLPGSILVNKEPLGTAFQLDVCPNRVTRSVLTAVYDLLQVRCCWCIAWGCEQLSLWPCWQHLGLSSGVESVQHLGRVAGQM